jgi:uroporphyrinogen-III synthase
MQTLLLTSNRSYPKLNVFCNDNNIKLIQQSFIDIEPINFSLEKKYDWIFFSSINGVKSFLSQDLAFNGKFAAIGNSTAEYMYDAGIQIDFIGDSSKTPKEIAKDFLNVSSGLIAHISSDKGTRILSKTVSDNTVTDIIAYKTLLKYVDLELSFDIIIVTSPSNYESLIKSNNTNTESSKVIAHGKTTYNCIKKDLHSTVTISESANVIGWINELSLILNLSL